MTTTTAADTFGVDMTVGDAGSVRATIHDAAGQELPIRGTYVRDALGELAAATVAVASNGSPWSETVYWVHEPGHWRWDFTRDGDDVRVTVAFVSDDEHRATDSAVGSGPARGTVRLDTHVPVAVFVSVVLAAFDGVVAAGGAELYDETWNWRGMRFPYVDYTRLRELALRGA